MMKKRALLFLGVAMMAALPAMLWAQGEKYPIIVIPTGKGPYTFPKGYTTPFDKVEMRVTEKMSPNLFVIHGSSGVDLSHPDASGGRMMILFGPDGVLMVDTNNRQTQEKTLAAIRSVTDGPLKVLVNTHIHSDHTGGNAFFAKQGAVIFAQENLRMDMLNPLRRRCRSSRNPRRWFALSSKQIRYTRRRMIPQSICCAPEARTHSHQSARWSCNIQLSFPVRGCWTTAISLTSRASRSRRDTPDVSLTSASSSTT
jgi:hypothetical protein